MSIVGLFLLAIALSADSLAASVAKGSRLSRPSIADAFIVAGVFAAFQVVMPLIGWKVGISLQPLIERIDHWIAFAILLGVGGKMIRDGLKSDGAVDTRNTLTMSALILSGVATSIDSLVVGFGFGFLKVSILAALAIIGCVTFVSSFGGFYLGRYVSRHFGEYVEVGAGLILIAIGAKILFDHLTA